MHFQGAQLSTRVQQLEVGDKAVIASAAMVAAALLHN
jgi:hypothetical protein